MPQTGVFRGSAFFRARHVALLTMPVTFMFCSFWNAVTAASQNADDYERATELERIGGEILALPVPNRPMLPNTPKGKMVNITPTREFAMA